MYLCIFTMKSRLPKRLTREVHEDIKLKENDIVVRVSRLIHFRIQQRRTKNVIKKGKISQPDSSKKSINAYNNSLSKYMKRKSEYKGNITLENNMKQGRGRGGELIFCNTLHS